jgi:alpha-1,3/alpha-1,6-mannosyltransferase
MERRIKKPQYPPPPTPPKNIIFLHPDLGIGGAERLLIDAAVGLQNLGHNVTIYTSHRSPTHCFDEARDGTLDVRVRGDSLLPPTILGRFKILCSILRQIHLILAITRSGELRALEPTAFFVDQLSAGIPVLRWLWREQRVLFYCHFPDLLLVRGRGRWWRRVWRVGFDLWEGWGVWGADRVVVNSGFTKGVVEEVWPGVGRERGVGVVYPCVNTKEESVRGAEAGTPLWKDKKELLSINRFERKKDVGLAIKAFAGLTSEERQDVRLVIAGSCQRYRSISQPVTIIDIHRWLRHPTTRKRNLPPRARIPRRLSRP